ncbi:MAG: hypothetical protein WAL36_13940 [Pseudolabrys sp.]
MPSRLLWIDLPEARDLLFETAIAHEWECCVAFHVSLKRNFGPGSRQTAMPGSPIAAKPRVGELRNWVETSLSPTRAGRDATKWRL